MNARIGPHTTIQLPTLTWSGMWKILTGAAGAVLAMLAGGWAAGQFVYDLGGSTAQAEHRIQKVETSVESVRITADAALPRREYEADKVVQDRINQQLISGRQIDRELLLRIDERTEQMKRDLDWMRGRQD